MTICFAKNFLYRKDTMFYNTSNYESSISEPTLYLLMPQQLWGMRPLAHAYNNLKSDGSVQI